MKRFTALIALLAMAMILAAGLTGCGSKTEGGGTDTMKDPAAGNWYIVDGSDITTLKLDGTGGGSIGGDSVSYSVDGDTVSLTIDGETVDVTMGDSEYGEVLKDDEGVIFAYRDKSAAKEIAAGGGSADYGENLLGIWYMPMDGEVQTLTFNEDGSVDYSAGASLTYEITGDAVTLINGSDTLELVIANDTIDGWVLKEADTGKVVAWQSETTATVSGMTDLWAEEGQTQSGSIKKEDFVGNWIGDSFSYGGVDMSLSEASMTFSIKINADGSAAAMTNGEADGSATWTFNDDGTITLKDGTGEIPDHSYIDNSGHLHLGLEADDGTMWIICHKE